MFDTPFDFFALLIAVVAFTFARKALNQAATLRARLDALEAAWQARPVTPPLAPGWSSSKRWPPHRPALPPNNRRRRLRTGRAGRGRSTGCTASLPPPPARPRCRRRFLKTDQTSRSASARWVVWIGGLTLALGGFFMVRYSIEAGLLGPGVRTLLGGAFALALLAAGEWTRRKESVSAIEALPIANIPAILTAAGTAVAFATVYAAYALYDFLAPATAFVLLGLVALGTLAAALLHGPALAGLGVAAAFVTPILVSSEKPDFWSLYIYLAIVTAAAFALARIRLWRWLAVTTIAAALLWTFPCLDCGASMVGPHDFHVIAGFVLAALLVVCGLPVRPAGRRGPHRADLIWFARGLSVGRHDDRAGEYPCRYRHHRFRHTSGGQLVGRLARAFRHRRGRRRRGVRLYRVRRMGGARQSGHAGAAGRPAARHGPVATDASVTLHLVTERAIFAGLFSRSSPNPGAGPLGQRDHPGGVAGVRRVHAAGAVHRTLCPHRPSRSLGAVCDPGRDPRRRLWLRQPKF